MATHALVKPMSLCRHGGRRAPGRAVGAAFVRSAAAVLLVLFAVGCSKTTEPNGPAGTTATEPVTTPPPTAARPSTTPTTPAKTTTSTVASSSSTKVSTTTSSTTTTTAPSTTKVTTPAPGSACTLGSFPDCIDPDGDGQGTYLIGGADCMSTFPTSPGLCSDLDGDGRAGYPDSG